MNYNSEQFYDYSDDLNELYKLRNDIAHSNKKFNLLKFNIKKNTLLLKMFLIKFTELKLAFDKSVGKTLDSKEDLVKFYDGINRLSQ